MVIAAIIIGVILLLAWLIWIPVTRRVMRIQGRITHAPVFQYNILPFIVGTGLIFSGNLLVLVMLPIAWVLSIFFPAFFLFMFPLVAGWRLGVNIFTAISPGSRGWYWGGGAIGVVFMYCFCTIVVGIVTMPQKRELLTLDSSGRLL